MIEPENYRVFKNAKQKQDQPSVDAISSRLRLAGTFFAYGDDPSLAIRKAIIDDLPRGTQHIVAEGDIFDGLQMKVIYRDRVTVLDADSKEYQLFLSMSGQTAAHIQGVGQGDPEELSSSTASNSGYLGGNQIGEHRWVFSRTALLDYYAEVRDEPERLLAVFDSLKPLYDEQSRITGYVLGTEGEKQFFDAVGLRENDVVRLVNTMPMTSRRRAEYFLSEFVDDRLNAFVIEIERQGEPIKLIYEVR